MFHVTQVEAGKNHPFQVLANCFRIQKYKGYSTLMLRLTSMWSCLKSEIKLENSRVMWNLSASIVIPSAGRLKSPSFPLLSHFRFATIRAFTFNTD